MDDSNIKKLIEAFISGDSDVQRRAKEALVKLGPSAVSALCEKLKYSNRDVQWSSASALGEIKDLTAVPALRKALYDSDSYVRRYSADSLGEIKDLTAVPALRKALYDSDSWVRSSSARALGKIKDPTAVPALCEALQDSDRKVRESAVEVLTRIGDSSTLPRKILACSRLTTQKRIEAPNSLRKARKGSFSSRLFSFSETRKLCESVLLEEDLDARTGAQAVLDWMNGDKNLLRASQPDASKESKELLRAASGVPDTKPTSLLRASDEPVKELGLPGAKT